MMKAIAIYLATGVILCEISTWLERRRGAKTTVNQYCNIVFLWPLIAYLFIRQFFRRK